MKQPELAFLIFKPFDFNQIIDTMAKTVKSIMM